MAIKILSVGSGRIDSPDSENMIDFAVHLINRAARKKYSIMDERIAILHLDHGTELLMKAYLLKERYAINEISKKKLKEGIKTDSVIAHYLSTDRTISFIEALDIVSKKVGLSTNTRKIIANFHNLRNEIQHRALKISLDKSEKIAEFRPQLKELYEKMFPELCMFGERIPTGESVTLHQRNIKFG